MEAMGCEGLEFRLERGFGAGLELATPVEERRRVRDRIADAGLVIANLGTEPSALAVRTESSIKSGRELFDRLKQDPAAYSISIGSTRSEPMSSLFRHLACTATRWKV